MNWEEAVDFYNIDLMYRDACFENARLLPQKIIEFGKRWVDSQKKTSLFLSGNVGAGKTYFTMCLLRGLVERGHRGIIPVKSGDLDTELLAAIEEKKEVSILRKYAEVDFLFIDDLGVERISDRIQRQYYSIIDHRTSNFLPTIMTSNYERKDTQAILGARITSRLEFACEIKFPDRDLRKQTKLPSL